MNGPFLLIRGSLAMARLGYALVTALLGARRGKAAFWAGFGLSAAVAVFLQLKGV